MSYCELLATANPINSCGQTLNIGTVTDTTGMTVRLTNLATGGIQEVALAAITVGVVSIGIPTDLSTPQVYSIEVMIGQDPQPFKPFTLVSGSYVPSANDVMGIALKFIKPHSSVSNPIQQWTILQ